MSATLLAFSSIKGLVTVAVWLGYGLGLAVLFAVVFLVWLALAEVYEMVRHAEWWMDHGDTVVRWLCSLAVAGVVFWVGGSHHGWGWAFPGLGSRP